MAKETTRGALRADHALGTIDARRVQTAAEGVRRGNAEASS